ncbi:C4-dicarboxylate TRAP transporter substrate-binding protein [Marinobacter sp. 1-3A]|uniref:C4-dicarboxylate TRAP transporter substrate-binding protein n=1 Tax=Marinobacter sp. 1-3A TaxID=2582920 RepID=UPI001903E097|nr:C4-dicarboxylate TRAP transporter substrate-binding protein [Marinobacter sp. 1-3A]MBK1875030.1 C4-dicarboxylate TRAP transporter substrate-binding protein [Marinobacter sp. 1-3A]
MAFNKFLKSVVAGSVISLSTIGVVAAETTFRYGEASPNRGARAEALQYFADQLESRSGGDLKLDIHWGGALLKYSAILGGVRSGAADMGSVLAAYAPQEMRALSVGDIPVPQSDSWVGMRAMYELMATNPEMQRAFEDNGVVYVTNMTTSPMQFECAGNTRLESLADFKGKKVRASAIYAKILNDAGANMVNFVFSEVYQALDTGLVDCSGTYLYAMRAFKTPEVVSSVAVMDWGQIAGFGMLMNKWSWDDLSSEQRSLFRQIGSEMIDYYAQKLVEERREVLAELPTGSLGNKVEVISWSEEARAELFAESDKYVQEWIRDMEKAGYNGTQIWDDYQALLKKYQGELDAKGYPWARS